MREKRKKSFNVKIKTKTQPRTNIESRICAVPGTNFYSF